MRGSPTKIAHASLPMGGSMHGHKVRRVIVEGDLAVDHHGNAQLVETSRAQQGLVDGIPG